MNATIGAWKRFSLIASKEQNSPRRFSAETQKDARDSDNTADRVRQHENAVVTAGWSAGKWPQFFALWQIIGGVSAYDAFLAMKYRDELVYMERNLLGRMLLSLNDGDPSVFLGVKFVGTTFVLGVLANVYHSRPQRGLVIAKAVATFQIALLAYLTLG